MAMLEIVTIRVSGLLDPVLYFDTQNFISSQSNPVKAELYNKVLSSTVTYLPIDSSPSIFHVRAMDEIARYEGAGVVQLSTVL